MLAYIETRIKEIKEEMSLEEVKEYFNDKENNNSSLY